MSIRSKVSSKFLASINKVDIFKRLCALSLPWVIALLLF